MRTIFNILLIAFVVVTIYTARNDLATFIDKVQTGIVHLVGKTGESTTLPQLSSFIDKIRELTNKPITPGPLIETSGSTLTSNSALFTTVTLIDETNVERKKSNLLALLENKTLDRSAEDKVDDLFAKQYFEHVSPTGISVSDLVSSEGYDYILVGENLALGGFKTPQSIIDAWMASPGHKANILNTRYTEIGISVKKGFYKGDEVWIAVQHFGEPKSVCPSIDPKLKTTIDAEQITLSTLEGELTAKKAEIDASKNKNTPEYQALVQEYNILADEYNNTVHLIQNNIATYNAQVTAFNLCAQGE